MFRKSLHFYSHQVFIQLVLQIIFVTLNTKAVLAIGTQRIDLRTQDNEYVDSLARFASDDELFIVLQNSLDVHLSVCQKRYDIAVKKGRRQEIARALVKLGEAEIFLDEPGKAQNHLTTALSYLEKSKDFEAYSSALQQLGNIRLHEYDVLAALELYEKALEVSLNIENDSIKTSRMGSLKITKGKAYEITGLLDEALKLYTESGVLYEKIDSKIGRANCWQNTANIYMYEGNYTKALQYYFKAMEMLRPQEKLNKARLYLFIGMTYEKYGQLSNAENYYKKSYDLSKLVQDKTTECTSLAGIAGINLIEKSNIDEIIRMGEESLKLAKVINRIYNKMAAADLLAQAYKEKGDFKKALEMTEYYGLLNEELQFDKKNSEVRIKDFREQVKKRELAANSKNNQIKNDNKYMKRLTFWSILIGTIGIVGLSIYFVRKNRRVRKEREILVRKISALRAIQTGENSLNISTSVEEQNTLDKNKIDKFSDFKLNETDWKILRELEVKPQCTNQELADKICMSYDGVVSSLRKMYKLFEINTKRNHRLNLLMELYRISQDDYSIDVSLITAHN